MILGSGKAGSERMCGLVRDSGGIADVALNSEDSALDFELHSGWGRLGLTGN